ncbi:MAG: hypothetical protein KAF27_04675 [Porphyrobacter sp.]|nr:hypothetical protein [Porphyrobacter sp.]
MKFIKLESRGGNYLVVASNVAWLRTAENGQTSVGIIGGQPLLVVGSVEEVAEKILAGLAGGEAEPAPAPAPAPVAAPTPDPTPLAEALAPEPVASEAEAAPAPAPEPAADIVEAAPEPVAEPEIVPDQANSIQRSASPARPRPISARSASMWERPASAAAAKNLKVKSGSQRMMGQLE